MKPTTPEKVQALTADQWVELNSYVKVRQVLLEEVDRVASRGFFYRIFHASTVDFCLAAFDLITEKLVDPMISKE